MKDRVPTYPGRVKLTLVDGEKNVYDMTRADEPMQEGTPLNKATLLKDTTAEAHQLGEDATPDAVFAKLAWRIVGKYEAKESGLSEFTIELKEDLRKCTEFVFYGTNGFSEGTTNPISVSAQLIFANGETRTPFGLGNVKRGEYSCNSGYIFKIDENNIVYNYGEPIGSKPQYIKILKTNTHMGDIDAGAKFFLKAR